MLRSPAPQASLDLKEGWLVITLLFAFAMINIADKMVLSFASVPLMRELGLTNTEFGGLAGAYFLLFSLSAVVAGLAGDRLSPKLLLVGLAVVFSLAQLPMALSEDLGVLTVSRVVLGAAQGPAIPLALLILYSWFTDQRRTVPTALLTIGTAAGAVLAGPGLTYLIVSHGWRSAFFALAVFGLTWALLCLLLLPVRSAPKLSRPLPESSFKAVKTVFATPTGAAVLITGFVANGVGIMTAIWSVPYLTTVGQFSQTAAGWIISANAASSIALALALGSLSQFLVLRNRPRFARAYLTGLALTIAGSAMIGIGVLPFGPSTLALMLAGVPLIVAVFIVGPVILGQLAPEADRGAVLGINTAVYSLGGMLAPPLLGLTLDSAPSPQEGYRSGFIVAGGMLVCAGVLAAFLIRPDRDLARVRLH